MVLTQESINGQTQETEAYTCPLYGELAIDSDHWKIINTKEFQRLKDVKQLGGASLYFEGADHSRFEHCIGTMKVSDLELSSLKAHQGTMYDFLPQHLFNINTAALCHDIGHGPFSHTFDNNFIQKRFPELNWCHERCSVELFEHMIDENNIDCFEKEDIRMVQDLIIGSPSQNQEFINENGWMYEIGKFKNFIWF
jgi:HD superfamily phosphohydrolase